MKKHNHLVKVQIIPPINGKNYMNKPKKCFKINVFMIHCQFDLYTYLIHVK